MPVDGWHDVVRRSLGSENCTWHLHVPIPVILLFSPNCPLPLRKSYCNADRKPLFALPAARALTGTAERKLWGISSARYFPYVFRTDDSRPWRENMEE
jgi:hypothetical protein